MFYPGQSPCGSLTLADGFTRLCIDGQAGAADHARDDLAAGRRVAAQMRGIEQADRHGPGKRVGIGERIVARRRNWAMASSSTAASSSNSVRRACTRGSAVMSGRPSRHCEMAPSVMRHASISSAAVVAWCASVWPTMWTMCGLSCICKQTVAARWPRATLGSGG